MPYFSFSLKQNFLNKPEMPIEWQTIKVNKVYFSKNTLLWKNLIKNKNKEFINNVKFENRLKNNNLKGKTLFCLPPSIGLGDSIEYALAFNSIFIKKEFKNSAIAFCGKYKIIFEKYFDFKNKVYADFISQNEILKFDNIFHLSLEIPELKYQKYIRSDIESVLTKFFKTSKKRKPLKKKKIKINKINIFPISKSPIRTMPANLINEIIVSFSKKYEINVVLDNSAISVAIEKNIKTKNFNKLKPESLESLIQIVKKTEFGIFVDSGPLHLAKIFGIEGVLMITTVSDKILLNNFKTIHPIKNFFTSAHCVAPCGLTNLFNYNNLVGCYESLKIKKENLLKIGNINSMQRGQIKKTYTDFIDEPVSCIKNIKFNFFIDQINQKILK